MGCASIGVVGNITADTGVAFEIVLVSRLQGRPVLGYRCLVGRLIDDPSECIPDHGFNVRAGNAIEKIFNTEIGTVGQQVLPEQ